jgi:hypothetical protein
VVQVTGLDADLDQDQDQDAGQDADLTTMEVEETVAGATRLGLNRGGIRL